MPGQGAEAGGTPSCPAHAPPNPPNPGPPLRSLGRSPFTTPPACASAYPCSTTFLASRWGRWARRQGRPAAPRGCRHTPLAEHLHAGLDCGATLLHTCMPASAGALRCRSPQQGRARSGVPGEPVCPSWLPCRVRCMPAGPTATLPARSCTAHTSRGRPIATGRSRCPVSGLAGGREEGTRSRGLGVCWESAKVQAAAASVRCKAVTQRARAMPVCHHINDQI